MHGIAVARPRTAPASSQSGGSTGAPVVAQAPRITPPAIQVQVPQVPQVPVQVPVQVPTVQLPPVQVPVPPLPVPPPPQLP
jgi:hypothetical protein